MTGGARGGPRASTEDAATPDLEDLLAFTRRGLSLAGCSVTDVLLFSPGAGRGARAEFTRPEGSLGWVYLERESTGVYVVEPGGSAEVLSEEELARVVLDPDAPTGCASNEVVRACVAAEEAAPRERSESLYEVDYVSPWSLAWGGASTARVESVTAALRALAGGAPVEWVARRVVRDPEV